MSDPEPNAAQREVIETTEGIVHVDAGAGTGKTFALTRRYAEIVDQPDVTPEDVLLVTFTNGAATEMRDRVVAQSTYSLRTLADASIQTFHSRCGQLLDEYGHRAPEHLGLAERIPGSIDVIEDDLVIADRFAAFVDEFREAHPEHADCYCALDEPGEVRAVIEELAAKGVFPTADGWYRDGRDALAGDAAAFEERLADVNRPRNDGRKQSELRQAMTRYGRDRTYLPEAPSRSEARGDGKSIPDDVAERAFAADRESLFAFVHDAYHEYLSFALRRGYLTHELVQLFAYVLLCENHAVRRRVAYDYVMVDEFQDTSAVQFQLALLFAATDNLCVVGDWKQSIYAFQYADVGNALHFEERLQAYAERLNDDGDRSDDDGDRSDDDGDRPNDDADRLNENEDRPNDDGDRSNGVPGADRQSGSGRRVDFPVDDVRSIELTENYRSTETVLNLSEQTLRTPATDGETVEDPLGDVVSLSANASFDETNVDGVAHEDEHEAVLATIQHVVGNEDYPIEDEDGERTVPEYGDVAVLTRTRAWGRELLATADRCGVPVAYDGGVELYRTDAAKRVLAWLRVLESDAERGWAPILEDAGYRPAEIESVLETGAYPDEMSAFRDRLEALASVGVGAVARAVLHRYGHTDETADVLVETLQSLQDGASLTRGDLIRHVERGVEEGTTVDVTTGAGEDAVTVQTIHAAKGREYPIVVLANMNDGAFPPRAGGAPSIYYEEPIGLRRRRVYADGERHPHRYHDWTHDVLRHLVPDGHDEERRLLYVAVTRAEHHVCFAAGEEPNAFFEGLPVEELAIDPTVRPVDRGGHEQTQLPFEVLPPEGPRSCSPHDLMDDSVFERDDGDGLRGTPSSGAGQTPTRRSAASEDGRSFGNRVHRFAEDYARGQRTSVDVDGDDDSAIVEHCAAVATFLDGLEGSLSVEEPVVLPLSVAGERVAITGTVDLVHETGDAIEVVDYKTDRSREAHEQYRIQCSVYAHVVAAAYPDREVTASLFYTGSGDRVPIDPRSLEELEELVADRTRVGDD